MQTGYPDVDRLSAVRTNILHQRGRQESHLRTVPRPETEVPTVSKDYDYATATEAERWAYDQGIEAALDPSKMDLEDIQHALEACVGALRRINAEERDPKTVDIPEDLHDSNGDDFWPEP